MSIELPVILVTRPALSAEEVARLLGYASADRFLEAKKRLEEHGFPAKLPGMNRWSHPSIMRWFETNGATHLPAEAEPRATDSLERRYA